MDAFLLDSALRAAGLPIAGVSIGKFHDRSTWTLAWAVEPTAAQREQAEEICAVASVNSREDWEADWDERIDKDRLLRLLFEANFDQENRLRQLEQQPLITRAQYLNALKTTYAELT